MTEKKILTHYVAKSWINLLSNPKENQNMNPKRQFKYSEKCSNTSSCNSPLWWIFSYFGHLALTLYLSEVSFHVSRFIFHVFESNHH